MKGTTSILAALLIAVCMTGGVYGSALRQAPEIQRSPSTGATLPARVLPGQAAAKVPEPGGFALFGTGLLILAALLRWRMRSTEKGRSLPPGELTAGHYELDKRERPPFKPVQNTTFTQSKPQSKAAGGNAA